MRLLVDECLSHELAAAAREFGYEAHHVAHLKRAGTTDSELMALILDRDFTFVTNNAVDFRKLYQRTSLHAGLILMLDQFQKVDQVRALREVLAIVRLSDLVNKAVEVSGRPGGVAIRIFDLPPGAH